MFSNESMDATTADDSKRSVEEISNKSENTNNKAKL